MIPDPIGRRLYTPKKEEETIPLGFEAGDPYNWIQAPESPKLPPPELPSFDREGWLNDDFVLLDIEDTSSSSDDSVYFDL